MIFFLHIISTLPQMPQANYIRDLITSELDVSPKVSSLNLVYLMLSIRDVNILPDDHTVLRKYDEILPKIAQDYLFDLVGYPVRLKEHPRDGVIMLAITHHYRLFV